MAYNLEEFNIVILASSNNPSILNPDFLRANNIIDESYKPSEVISTRPFSLIRYEEKLAITVDEERVTFVDLDEKRIPNESPIPRIATQYIKTLPHVPYNAVGFNFKGYSESATVAPSKFITNKFIKEGPWSNRNGIEPATSLTLVYQAATHKLTLNLAPAITKRGDKSFDSIYIQANIHCEPKERSIEKISEHINNWKQYYNNIKQLLEEIFK